MPMTTAIRFRVCNLLAFGVYSTIHLAIYNQAFSTNLLQSDVEQIIPVTLARAGFERRRFEASDSGTLIYL